MSRLVKESDEEIDVKPGRKTRANIEVISADSPLRRSSRIKPNVKQNESSPESPLSDSSIVSTTQTSRITRQRASAMDNSAINENRRTLRSRISSISSDVNEIPESDVGTPTKKTRNSTFNDSNKTNTRKRAGSEAKSPQPASRLVKRNVRASSVGPEANTPNKQQHGELLNTPIKTRRRTSVLMSEPVVEEKGEYMKYPVVTLDRTLPDLIETRESGTENSPKTSSKDESLPTLKNKLNTSRNSINEKHSEDDVKGPHNNPPENVSSNNFEDIGKDVFNDKKISDKNLLESSKTLPVDNTNETESLIDNESKILPQNKDENTFIEDLNNPVEKHDGHNNKENLTTNIVTDLQDIKNTISNTQQSPKHVSINNLNANVSTEEKCKYPCIETSVSPKCRHSKQSLEMANENVSMKEVNTGVISNLPPEGLDISINEEDNSNNMQNLVVGTKTESVIGSPCSESLDKNGPLQVISTNASSNDNVESVELVEDINTVDDNKSTEIGTELNVESKRACIHASNANISIEMDVSNTKENINENESEQNDINQCITDDQYDTKSKSDNLNTSENVHENDDISCIKLISSSKLSNIDSSNSVDVKSVSDTQRLTFSKHEDVPCLKNISETSNLSPNTSNLLKSSDAHMSIEDSTLINMNEANVTNVIKSSDSSIVTETPAEFVEEAPERGEQSKKVSVLDDSTDPLRLKKQYQNKLESNENHTKTNQVASEECQENMKADDNDSDTSVSHTFQDISASEWKEKNDMDKNSIHSKTTENESEAECDLVLVDREAWLAAENLKTNKEKISFDYDSDDTVILKAHSDSMKAKNENNLMDISEDECKLNDSKDKSPKGKKRKNIKQNENKDEEENRNTVKDTKNITKDVEISINVGENTSTTKDSNKYSTPNSNMSLRKSLKNNSLSESYKTTEREENLSLNKSKLSEDIPKGRKSLNKSVQGANRLEESNAAETVKKRKSLNKSNCNENIVTPAKKNGTNQSLNTSKEKMKPQQLDENSEESDYDLKKVSEKQDSATKKRTNRNFSTIANMGSDSNETQNSDDSQNKLEIPKFLFCGTSNSSSDNDNESNSSVDSDIQKEYNFYGKDVAKFSDDDVPGDECRASETESSDPDDNGSDLADFVVDDDEIEDEEEDKREENKDGSIENDKLHDEEQTKEDKGDDGEEIKQETIQEEEQYENDKENIAEKETDASNEEKNTSRKSGDLSMSQTIRSDKKKKKNLKTDTSQIEETEKGDNYPDLSFETKRMKQKRNSKEFTVKNVEQSLNDSQLIFDTKVLKLSKSIECSTPKISVPKQEKLNVKTCGAEENDSLDEEKDKDLTLKEEQNVKKLRSIKNNETLMHRSLPSELTDLATKTNLSRPMSSKVPELNKSTIVLGSETPTTKYLRQLKLNESAPILNTNFKKLTNTSNGNEQNDQDEEENENNDEQNTKAAPSPNDSLKKKLLKVAENILENDRQKKRKKRKQPIVEQVTKSTLSETDFPENNDSKLLKTAKQFVPTSNIDNNDETEKENKKKRKKKKKTNNTDVQMQEESNEQVTEIKLECQDEKIHNEIKKKKKKEKKVPDVQDVQDLTNEKTKIEKKKKKKGSIVLSGDNIPNEQLLKKKQKLLAKDAALQDKKALLEKLPKKKRELLSEDDALQYEVPPKKVPKKKQKLSSDVSDQKENTSVPKLSKKKQKQLLEGVKTDNIKYTVASNKTQQFHDAVSDSDEGPEMITFSKARDEALKDLKRTADNIKANKEMKRKKQREHNETMQKQKEIKINQLKSKNQVTESNKTDIQEKGIKRLSDYIVKNLSDVPLKSSKKRKLSEEKSSLSPMCSFKQKKMKNMYIEDDITLPSCAGNTTEFSVVDIETIKKKKKVPKASLFRERMLARNPRQPISAYLTYLKKQKSLGKGKFYDNPY
ncbi:dentin sialophosphoprotein-like isoform X2 [Bombus pyrosoma]|uniref:dentin sialophosphoprotein-like isoform X2 n=1 Tax=Bombus pyrosoma TaxID=396416 RepID=UPI001CB9C5FD|nr:dentin sialophosphoprotein-like isoform X2 [Bombus pyrosoma]